MLLVDPGQTFYPYIKQVDLRGARTFRIGSRRLQTFLEVFNLPNVSTVLQMNEIYGPFYLYPQIIEQPRRLQVGMQLDF